MAILIAVCLLFSAIIYTSASREVVARIDDWQATPLYRINEPRFLALREQQQHQAEANLIASLAIANIAIWTIGGIGSYYLARRTLHPIEEAHEAQSRFTSDASHELRTPLASMKTEIEVALRDPSISKQEMRELLSSNLEEVDKLSRLSHMLLQLSRLDHGNIILEKVALLDVAKGVIGQLDKEGRRIELTGHPSHKVLANRSSVEELMTILLDNALKYSPENSKVRMNLLTKKQLTGFEIINQGEGIPAEALPHIFDRFYRIDSSRSNGSKKGYGLGLSLAKKIVELSGGELTVSSAPQHDTTFTVFMQNLSKSKAKDQS
ncbi:MAG TPA: ATP-binding protein [Candidatus Saccharimonadales bacterium]|nr:ATP-binding protein [Candidatus Saccharimonadales bacterium]